MMGVGVERQMTLNCQVLCAQPSISKDYRNVFHRKLKARDPLAVKKAFIISRNAFEFGPLLVGRPQPAADTPAPQRDHAEATLPLPLTPNPKP